MPRPLARSRNRKSSSLLPQGLQDSITRFFRTLAGGIVIAIALALAASLFSYDPRDPSWNTAQVMPGALSIHNICRIYGAYAADLVMQIFGFGGFLLPVMVAAWGWRIASEQGLDLLGRRLLAAFSAMLALGIALGSMGGEFGITAAQSGAFGKIIGGGLVSLLPPPWGAILFAPLFGVVAILTLYLACALSLEEWQWIVLTLHQGVTWVVRQMRYIAHKMWRLLHREQGDLDEDEEEEKEEEYDEEEEEEEDDDDDEEERGFFSKPAHKKKTRAKKGPLIKRPAATARQARLALRSDTDQDLPSLDLLQWPDNARQQATVSEDALEKNAKLLETVLEDFGVNGQITKVSPGPVVTLYELEPAPGTRASRVISLADDIARNMSAASVRVAIVPGRNVIGIELPNARREMVYLRELLSTEVYQNTKAVLPLVLGKDIAGHPVIADLAKMPHLLVAGTTGSGKSVAINTMILSLIYHMPPQKCRFIMVDPKMLELSVYDGIPHLLAPVVTEPKKAIMALRWTVREMEERYRAMSKLGVRNIDGYNARLREAAKRGEDLMRTVQTGFDRETGKPVYEEQPLDLTELPYIVVIVDEMADLMMVAGKEIEAAIQRLAQMARAAGIHILMATQRPSVDVITGTIKANFPTRISFQVTSKIDSRTILGEQGAEQLLGQGDMLYMAGGGRITRVHGPFVRDDEVEGIVKFLKTQGEPEYLDEVTEDDGSDEGMAGGSLFGGGGAGDELYDKAVDIVLRERKASTSFIQRQLQIGYNKAANLVERMEREGLIGPASATGKREIYGRDARDD
ncbi:MAG: DNA translocase FtsK 4TM domain-containing protein [Alphaproteobacteria bacterium]|nr:DNA translocase FtsK 4TM domain-containing protein [Alphaproteobacteria bacterium]